jgi:hypothetical protein
MPGEGRVEVSLDRSMILFAAMSSAPDGTCASCSKARAPRVYRSFGPGCKGHASTASNDPRYCSPPCAELVEARHDVHQLPFDELRAALGRKAPHRRTLRQDSSIVLSTLPAIAAMLC